MRARFQPSLLLTATLVALPIVTAFAWPSRVDAAALAFEITQSDPARLERGLAAIEIDQIREDLTYIASDELAGRDTPSEGQKIAARFIAKRLADLDFEVGGPDGFIYTYPLTWRQVDGANSMITLSKGDSSVTLEFGEDYYLDRGKELTDHSIDGQMVSVGEGSKSDFADTDARGKWVLCYQAGASMRRVSRRAEGAGALGLVVMPAEDYSGKPYKRAFANTMSRLGAGSVSWWRGFSSKSSVFPKFYLSESGREKFAGVAGGGPFGAGTPVNIEVSEA